jgi:2-hydroxy-3-keto-5-methylthiopentenyl-1-phosphate phosphatase
LKKFAGRLLGAEAESGTPSQLISRRAPVASLNRPLAPATVPPPRSVRKVSRVGVIAAAFAPVLDRTISAKEGATATARPANPTAMSTVTRQIVRKAEDHKSSWPVALVADYDGTITERDLLQAIAYEFGDPEIVDELDRALDEGRITLRDEIVGEYATVQAPLEDVLEWMFERTRIRPGLHPLLALAHARGWSTLVVSSGFHELIEPVFAREGIEVELFANRVDPRPDGWIVDWRYGDDCPVCGQSCKRATVDSFAAGGEVVYIGDGYSDRCAGESADRVFATSGLAQHLESKGVPYEPFRDFFDIAAALAPSRA